MIILQRTSKTATPSFMSRDTRSVQGLHPLTLASELLTNDEQRQMQLVVTFLPRGYERSNEPWIIMQARALSDWPRWHANQLLQPAHDVFHRAADQVR